LYQVRTNDQSLADPHTGPMTTVGVVHPGEMGVALAASLTAAGNRVIWASAGRSAATAARAGEHGLKDVGELEAVASESDVILSICPPHAAVGVARALTGFGGLYVDANAIAPGTAQEVAAVVGASGGTYVDGGVIGPPPWTAGTTRLYLSGRGADQAAKLFDGSVVDARVISPTAATAASALKMTYAAWTKGSDALLLAIEATAERLDVADALHREWSESQPQLAARSQRAAEAAAEKGWRWTGEMEQIAATFDAVGVPPGFHLAAAEVFRDAG